jgi:hypothetical protein
MFLVGIAGPHLAVSGAIFTERFVSQRLTDYIYLGSLPTYQEGFPLDHSIRRVAQVLRALSKATNELADYYLKLRFTIPPTLEPYSPHNMEAPALCRFLCIQSVRAWCPHISKSTTWTAKITP